MIHFKYDANNLSFSIYFNDNSLYVYIQLNEKNYVYALTYNRNLLY